MDKKKNDNEKTMKYINCKLKEGEIPLMLQSVHIFNKSLKEQAKLIITSSTIFLVQNLTIKKYIKAVLIQCVTVTPFSNELLIFYDSKGDQSTKQSIRIESQANLKIIQDIISVRQRFCEMTDPLPVIVSSNISLESIAALHDNTNKSRIFGFLFKKKQQHFNLRQRFSGEGQLLYVNQYNFALQIGQKMYSHIYKNVTLLYISNSENFRFFQQRYDVQQLGPKKRLFRLNSQYDKSQSSTKTTPKKNVLMRKIIKSATESDKIISQALRSYKNQEYKQQILFAIQTEIHFEILTQFEQGQRDCQMVLEAYEYLCQKDLKSILFKLLQMIQNSTQIFCSLSPQNIIVGNHGFRISKIFSCLTRRTLLDYMAPEEFQRSQFDQGEVKLINLWKVGVLLFQLAYGNVPFPAEYIAESVLLLKTQIEIFIPDYSFRSQQFQDFIHSILMINPKVRGQKASNNTQPTENWKTAILKSSWVKLP